MADDQKYQIKGNKNYSLAAIDIGNSRLKLLFGNNYFVVDYHDDWKKDVQVFIESLDSAEWQCGVSSVNSQIYDELLEIIKNRNISIISPQHFSIPISLIIPASRV